MLWIPTLTLHVLDGICRGALKLVPRRLIITSKTSVSMQAASLAIAHLTRNGKDQGVLHGPYELFVFDRGRY